MTHSARCARAHRASLAAVKLLALRANLRPFDPATGGDLPARFCVLPFGLHRTTKGHVNVTAETIAHLAAEQTSRGFDRVALDFGHNTVPGSEAYQGEPAKIAAVGQIEGDEKGLWLTIERWTPEGEELAKGGHYPDISPTVVTDDAGIVRAVHSVALCRQGSVPDLQFFSNPTITRTTTTMNPEALARELAKALGLSESATPEEILTAFTAALPKKDDGKKDEAEGMAALTAQLTALGEQVKALTAAQDSAAREQLLALAAAEGKDVPASAKTLPLEQLRTLTAELKPTIPLGQRTGTIIPLSAAKDADDYDPAIAGKLGVTKEQWAAAK